VAEIRLHTANGRAYIFIKGNVQMTEIKTYDELISYLDQEDQLWLTWKDTPEAMIEILKTPELISAPSARIKYAILTIHNDGTVKTQILNLQNGRLKSDEFINKMLKGCTIKKITNNSVSFEKVESI
jgi:hypothetical protein